MKIELPGNTQLKTFPSYKDIQNLYIKDESGNPYGTFKDRLAFKLIEDVYELISNTSDSILLIDALLLLKPTTFGVITLGNTSFPLGQYIYEINSISQSLIKRDIFRLISFTYHDKDERVIGPDTYGNTCKGIDIIKRLKETGIVWRLNLEEKFYDSRLLEEIARNQDLVIGDFQDITNGIELDGNKYPAYVDILKEILVDLGKEPNYIVVPAGAGILYNEFCDYVLENNLKTKVLGVTVARIDSIADKLFGFYWQDIDNLNKVGYSITRYGRSHLMVRADDNEINDTMHEIGSRINAEPSGVAGLAVLHRLKKYYPSFDEIKDSVVVVNTGNGIPNFSFKKGDN